jgi:hypothetical protein
VVDGICGSLRRERSGIAGIASGLEEEEEEESTVEDVVLHREYDDIHRFYPYATCSPRECCI